MNAHPKAGSETTLDVAQISPQEHQDFLTAQPNSSFLQNPHWAEVKSDWHSESVGLFHGDDLVAAALVLYRKLPVPTAVPILGKKKLAYIPEGPVFTPGSLVLAEVLHALTKYLQRRGAFLIRAGIPGVLRRWPAQEVRRALAAGENSHISELQDLSTLEDPETGKDSETAHAEHYRTDLVALGWQPPGDSVDFEAGQPQFQARIPLKDEHDRQLDVDAVLARMDQSSRRQTRKSTRSELTVSVGTADDLQAWQTLYEETAQRDDFTPRPGEYFRRMYEELNASPVSTCTLYLAHFEDTLLAAAIYVRQGEFSWYVYGASSGEERKRYAPRALQLRQIEDSLDAGCQWYDLGGLSPSLDPQYPLAGLTRFKTTMGADVVQTLGEWDYPVNKLLTKGFNAYMARR